jgi:hypothetical protein
VNPNLAERFEDILTEIQVTDVFSQRQVKIEFEPLVSEEARAAGRPERSPDLAVTEGDQKRMALGVS